LSGLRSASRLCQNVGDRNWFRRIVQHERRMAALTTPPLEHWNKATESCLKTSGSILGTYVLVFLFFAIFALASVIAYFTCPPLPDD
jgi:hypothetical protein